MRNWVRAALGIIFNYIAVRRREFLQVPLRYQIEFAVVGAWNGEVVFDYRVDCFFIAIVERSHAHTGGLLSIIGYTFEVAIKERGKLVNRFMDRPEVIPFLVW